MMKHEPSLPVLKKSGFRIPARGGMFIFMFLVVVMMGLRIQDVTTDIIKGKSPQPVTPALAETDKPAETHAEQKPEAKADVHKDEMPAKESEKEGDKPKEAKHETPDKVTADPVITPDQENFSDAEVNILKRLSERRQELDKRAHDLDQREALMKITEQRVDKKLADMKATQEQIKQMVSTIKTEEKAKTESLVKIYELMKPKEAARIFDALDMQTLLDVITNMKESRVSPILAAMDAQKAKQVTAALMQKKALPEQP